MDHSKIYYRPHKAGLAKQCPSSMLYNPNFVPKQEVGVRAHLGTAAHEIFGEYIVNNIDLTDVIIDEVAEKHNVQVNGYDGLAWRAKKLAQAWENTKSRGYFVQPVSEQKWDCSLSNGYQYSCYPDLYEIHDDWGVVLELKTGEVDTGWAIQARDYAMAMKRRFKEMNLNKIYTITYAPIVDYYHVDKFTSDQLDTAEEQLIIDMEKVGSHYVTGSLCPYCPLILNCKAIKNQIDPLSRDIQKAGEEHEITGAEIAKWRPAIKGLKKIIELFEDAQRMVLEAKGVIDLGDGTELYRREQYDKVIDAGAALSVMVDDFGVSRTDYISKLSIKVGDINELSRKTAKPGCIAKQEKAVWLKMIEEGAMKKELRYVTATRHKQYKKELPHG